MYQDMTALITGASSGLGEAFARQLAEQGANLVLVARSEDTLNRLAETLRGETRVQITVLPTDLSSAAEVDRLIDKIKSRALKIDLLINNVALYGPSPSNPAIGASMGTPSWEPPAISSRGGFPHAGGFHVASSSLSFTNFSSRTSKNSQCSAGVAQNSA
jgi:NAD(P)-dependent dehydrogenase (short-subunit alcohol dehydrogenase family)